MRKKSHNLSLKHIFAVVYILLSASCSTEAPISALSVLTGTNLSIGALKFREAISSQECASPCWIGIEAGTTNYSESLATLRRQYGMENVEAIPNFIEWTSSGVVDNSSGGGLSFHNGTVNKVYVGFEKPITVEELIEVIGQPQSVRMAIAFSPPGAKCAGASLFHPDAGIHASLSPEGGFVGVRPTQFVEWVEFLSPRLLENWHITDSIYVEWDGYRDYCPQ